MIYSKDDYKFSYNLDDIIIDGGIMPLRDDKSLMRGEDIAFLGETICDLRYSLRIYPDTEPPVEKQLISMLDLQPLAERPNIIASWMKSAVDSEGPYEHMFTTKATIGDVYNLWSVTSSEMPSPPANFWQNHVGIFNSIRKHITRSSDPEAFKEGEKCYEKDIQYLFDDLKQITSVLRCHCPNVEVYSYDGETWGDYEGRYLTGGMYRSYYYDASNPEYEITDVGGYTSWATNAEYRSWNFDGRSIPDAPMLYTLVDTRVSKLFKEGRHNWQYHEYLDMIAIRATELRQVGNNYCWCVNAQAVINKLASIRSMHGVEDLPHSSQSTYRTYEVQQGTYSGWTQLMRNNHTTY